MSTSAVRAPRFAGRLCFVCVLVAGCLLAAADATRAFGASGTVSLLPVKDSTLFEDNDEYASGRGDFLFSGSIASGSPRRALVQFDLSALPAGARVTSATLRVVVSRAGPASELRDRVGLHRVLASWGEGLSDSGTGGAGAVATPGDATWAYRLLGGGTSGILRQPWTSRGGDFVPQASVTTSVGGVGAYVFDSTPGLVADVQRWLDVPAENHGWILVGPEGGSQNAKRYWSRESFAGSDRPTLTITYTLAAAGDADVPLPGWALGLLGAGLATALSRRRAGRG